MLSIKDLLKILVSQDSTLNNEMAIADFLEGYLSGLGLQVKRINLTNGRFNVYAYRLPEKSDTLWYGHMDTVPVYDNWLTDPFKLKEHNGRYYGLGVCDMKGGIAALLYAVSNLSVDTPVRLLFCADEEYDSEGAWQVYNKHRDILKGVANLISMEPGASRSKVGGHDVLTLGRRGRIRLIVKIHGVSAHGGHPERGVNAADMASDLAMLYRNMSLPKHDKLGDATHYVASFISESAGLSLPEYAELEIDRHLVIPDTTQETLLNYQVIAKNYLRELVRTIPKDLASKVSVSVSLKKRKNDYMMPFITEEDEYIKSVINLMRKHDETIVLNYGKSVGDENVFAQIKGLRILIIGPEGGDIHAPNEWVSIDSLDKSQKIYAEILNS